MRVHRGEILHSRLQVVLAGPPLTHHEHSPVHGRGQEGAVRDGQQGRGVDDDEEVLRCQLQQGPHALRAQQLRRVRGRPAGGEQREVRDSGGREGVVRLHLTGQHLGQAHVARHLEEVVLPGPPQVGVHHEHPFAGQGQGAGQVRCDGRLALGGVRARERDDARRLVDGDELEVGAQRPDGLAGPGVEVHGLLARAGQGRVLRDGPDDAGAGDLLHVGAAAHLHVQETTEHGDGESRTQSGHRAQEDVAPGVRAHGGRGHAGIGQRHDLQRAVLVHVRRHVRRRLQCTVRQLRGGLGIRRGGGHLDHAGLGDEHRGERAVAVLPRVLCHAFTHGLAVDQGDVGLSPALGGQVAGDEALICSPRGEEPLRFGRVDPGLQRGVAPAQQTPHEGGRQQQEEVGAQQAEEVDDRHGAPRGSWTGMRGPLWPGNAQVHGTNTHRAL